MAMVIEVEHPYRLHVCKFEEQIQSVFKKVAFIALSAVNQDLR